MDIKTKKNKAYDQHSPYESFPDTDRDIYIYENDSGTQKERNRYRKGHPKKILGGAFFAVLFLILMWGGYFVFKIGFTGKKISIENNSPSVIDNVGSLLSSFIPSNRKMLKGEEEGRVNVLLLGTAGKGKPGQNLTDTIMMMSIDTKNKKLALLSLPRDFYANIPETSYYTKINSIYQYGINNKEDIKPMEKTIEEITGTAINYFIILNFDGFKKIIDDIGGINVYVERDIYDTRYPGPNYSYETFEIKKGTHLMEGETALKYVRERHDDPEGDFGRAKRQQKVMQAVKNKVFSLQTFLNPITLNKVLTDLGDNIKTDISMDEMEGFIDLSKKCDTQNISNVVVDAWKKESILKVSHVFAGGVQAFILVPRVGSYSEIQDLSKNIFDLDSIQRRKSEIEKENASIAIINQSKYKNLDLKIKEILEVKLGMKDIKIAYANSSKNLEESFIYDKAQGGKIFTLDEIIKKFKIKLGGDNNDIIGGQQSDLVLVLGNDLGEIESFEEDDPEEMKNAPDSQDYFELIKK